MKSDAMNLTNLAVGLIKTSKHCTERRRDRFGLLRGEAGRDSDEPILDKALVPSQVDLPLWP